MINDGVRKHRDYSCIIYTYFFLLFLILFFFSSFSPVFLGFFSFSFFIFLCTRFIKGSVMVWPWQMGTMQLRFSLRYVSVTPKLQLYLTFIDAIYIPF